MPDTNDKSNIRTVSTEPGQGSALATAIASYELLLARRPAQPDTWFDLAVSYRKQHRFESALAAYQNALRHGISRPEEVHVNCSVIYSDYLHREELAMSELHTALRINPSFVPALMNLANLHEDLGQREPAIAAYERILKADPNHFDALARLANAMLVENRSDPIIGRLQQAAAQPQANNADLADLYFALGRVHDACGEFDKAFAAYSQANQFSLRNAPPKFQRYDRIAHERLIDEIIEAFPQKRDTASNTEGQNPPIFICGMLRSGSTLVESVLGRHSRVTAGGEFYFLPRLVRSYLSPFPSAAKVSGEEKLATLSRLYLNGLDQLFPNRDCCTDKRLENFLYVGLIKAMFPTAKIIHTIRSSLDTCLSVYFLHASHRMNYSFDLLDIGHYYQQHARLMQHWKSIYENDIIEFDYDAFVQAPPQHIENLLAKLGLDWQDTCLAPRAVSASIKTASSWQVREPIHAQSSGRWKNYATQVDNLKKFFFG